MVFDPSNKQLKSVLFIERIARYMSVSDNSEDMFLCVACSCYFIFSFCLVFSVCSLFCLFSLFSWFSIVFRLKENKKARRRNKYCVSEIRVSKPVNTVKMKLFLWPSWPKSVFAESWTTSGH